MSWDASPVSPARSNSSTSGPTVAEEAFIASACARVARFQVNSPVSARLRALCFRPMEEKPTIGGV